MSGIMEDTLARSLIDIYQQLHVYPGGRLLYGDLAEEWKKSRLRESDLEPAIEVCIALGYLDPVRTSDGMALALLTTEIPDVGGETFVERISKRLFGDLRIRMRGDHGGDPAQWNGDNRRH